MNPYINHYQQNQVQTASREQILLMLYEGAIRFTKQARMAMEEGDRIRKLEKVSRTVAILTELSNTLDFETGGEIAENLDGLYAFMTRELTRSNIENDPEPLQTVIDLLSDLHEGWVQAVDIAKGEASGSDLEQDAPPPNQERRAMSVAL
ncbi:MAG: flagellar export chaperone FliS [Desulfohalobiaceae bacterium]|nr:flagellar export chaperone FliS [Desulfohalobiaceae bacterium]